MTTTRTTAPLASPTHKNNWVIKVQLPGHFRNPMMESEAVCIHMSFYNIYFNICLYYSKLHLAQHILTKHNLNLSTIGVILFSGTGSTTKST